VVAALLGRKAHAGRAIRPALRVKLDGAGTALNKPADLAHALRRLDKVTGVIASDDAPARYGEWIKAAALDFGASADLRVSGAFGTITEYAFGQSLSA